MHDTKTLATPLIRHLRIYINTYFAQDEELREGQRVRERMGQKRRRKRKHGWSEDDRRGSDGTYGRLCHAVRRHARFDDA